MTLQNDKRITSDADPILQRLHDFVGNPALGLPKEVFLFVSRVTPLVNVDLLIKDEQDRTLLTWREDEYYGAGWHLPGGIVRFKERLEDRLRAVARLELDADICFETTPLATNEIISSSRDVRGHFISFLFRCSLIGSLPECRRFQSGKPVANEWKWHIDCPEDLLEVHRVYERFLSHRMKEHGGT